MTNSHRPFTSVFSSPLDALTHSMRHPGIILTAYPWYHCTSWFDAGLSYDLTQPMTRVQRDDLVQLVQPLGDVKVFGGNLTPRWVGVEIEEDVDTILEFMRGQRDALAYAVYSDWLLCRPEPTVHTLAHVEAVE